MTFSSKRFEVKANPWGTLGAPSLANLTDFFPGDDERLKYMFQPKGGSASFDPVAREFYPNNGPPDFGGGGQYVNGQFVPVPRISPINEGQFSEDSNGCPHGFYQFGKVCVPNADINPLGGTGGLMNDGTGTNRFFGKGDAKGVINAVTPPQFTAKNQEFIVTTQMQNIGGQPAKFFTRINIPDIGLTGDASNSTMVMPLAKMTIGHRVIMPATVTSSSLLPAKVELVQVRLSGTGQTDPLGGQVDDVGTVSIPSPGYKGALPPPGGGLAGTIPSGQNIPLGGLGGVIPMPGYPGTFAPPPGFGGGPPGMPLPPIRPPMGWRIGLGPWLTVNPVMATYPAGTPIIIAGGGFMPFETVVVQLYSVSNLMGIISFRTRLKQQMARVGPHGMFMEWARVTVPNPSVGTAKLAIVAVGTRSGVKKQQVISVSRSNRSHGIHIGDGFFDMDIGLGGGSTGGQFASLGGLLGNMFGQ